MDCPDTKPKRNHAVASNKVWATPDGVSLVDLATWSGTGQGYKPRKAIQPITNSRVLLDDVVPGQ